MDPKPYSVVMRIVLLIHMKMGFITPTNLDCGDDYDRLFAPIEPVVTSFRGYCKYFFIVQFFSLFINNK